MDFGICETPDILRVIYFIKIIINIIKIIVPIGLILMVTFDFAKGVISEDKKAGDIFKTSKNRILSAILIFLMPTIVNIVLEIVDEKTTYESCWVNAEANTIAFYQEKWDAEEEKKKQEEEEKKQEENNKPNSNNTCYFCTGSPADGKLYTTSPTICNDGTWTKVNISKCNPPVNPTPSDGTIPDIYAGTKEIDVTDIGCTLYYDLFDGTIKKSLYVNASVADELHEILKKSCTYINNLDIASPFQTSGVGSYKPEQFTEGNYHNAALAIDLNNQWSYTSSSGKKYYPYGGQGEDTWAKYKQFVCEVCNGNENCKYNINYVIYERYFKPKGWCWGGNWGPSYFDPMHFQKSLGACSVSNKGKISC